jgi:hypothetical protein
MKRRGKYVLLALVSVVYFWIGVLKWNYLLNPWIAEGGFLLPRYSTEAQQNYNSSYTDGIRYFLLTPKWISTLLYGNIFLGLNLLVIYLVYEKQIYIKFTFWLFFWVSFLSVAALALGLFTQSYGSIYPIVSRIKELQQSPFTLFLLLAAFKLHKDE